MNENIQTIRRNGFIQEFLNSVPMARLYTDSSEFGEVMKGMYPGDNFGSREEYARTIDGFSNWWSEQKNVKRGWVGITGSWRTIDQRVVDDTTHLVRKSLENGLGIITGGALGVDYIATEIVLKEGNPHTDLRVVLPTEASTYMSLYGHSVDSPPKENEGNEAYSLDPSQAAAISEQVYYMVTNHPEALFQVGMFNEDEFMEPWNLDFRRNAYLFRNNFIAMGCDGMAGFQVNDSEGVKHVLTISSMMTKPIYQGGPENDGYIIDKSSIDVIRDYGKLDIANLPDDYPIRRVSRKTLVRRSLIF